MHEGEHGRIFGALNGSLFKGKRLGNEFSDFVGLRREAEEKRGFERCWLVLTSRASPDIS